MLNASVHIIQCFHELNLFQMFGINKVTKVKHGVLAMVLSTSRTVDDLHVEINRNDEFEISLYKKLKSGGSELVDTIDGVTVRGLRESLLDIVMPGWNSQPHRTYDHLDNVDALIFSGDPQPKELDYITYMAARWLKRVAHNVKCDNQSEPFNDEE